MMEETGTGRGFKITHETESGQKTIIEAHYNETGGCRLALVIDGKEVYLTPGESSYFMAWIATWYDQGGN